MVDSFTKLRIVGCLTLLAGTTACPAPGPALEGDAGPPGDRTPPEDTDSGGGPVIQEPMCDPETNMFCRGSDDPLPQGCGSEEIDLTPSGVQVTFLIDGSHSMEVNWYTVAEALEATMETYTDIAYGLHMFYADSDGWGFVEDGNLCGEERNVVLDVSPDNGQNIFDTLGPRPPGPGNRFVDTSPVVQALNYYLENDTSLSNPDTTNYLVLISDVNDNCFGTFLAGDDDKNAAFAKIGIELQKRHIRLIPIGFDAATGMRDFMGEVQTNLEALETLTRYGGSALEDAIAADDPEALQRAILQVGTLVTPCRFTIPAALDPSQGVNAFELDFFINNVEVERDRTDKEGWNFVNGNTSEVEFRADACQAIRAGGKLEARKNCSGEAMCGTSAARLQTRTRAVQFAVDTSASMGAWPFTECVPYIDPNCLSWWGQATAAISDAMVYEANDDAEMGLQLFPTGLLDCEVSERPEVPPGDGTEITIIERLLSHLPVGLTPLVQVVENTAAHPGRLADADTTGALIVISDGAQNPACGEIQAVPPDDNGENGMTVEEVAAQRLAEASAQLYEETGTRVYAIKFGDGSDAAADDQLTQIAEHGGTETFRRATTGEELTEVLEEISDELASCEVAIDLDSPGADPEKLNIYLNGQRVPQDPARNEGWFWIDEDTKDSIELYGEACSELKTGRLSNLVVEYGCETVVVI